jgi:2-phosphosulfolactate phosphatase
MNRILNVHLLPELANPHDLAGHTSVVIDILRASTTITAALDAGAKSIVPCLTVEEARQLASQRPGAMLGGERGGKPLPGFDFGNSPAEYTSDRVAGRTIVFTTTNGTAAMTRCMGSAHVFVGAIVNRAALCGRLADEARVDLICAGTNDEFSLDDALAAGAIVERLAIERSDWELNDAALICRSFWRNEVGSSGDHGSIAAALSRSIGGRNLIEIGLQDDLPFASRLDSSDRIPELDRSNWEITAS